MLMPDVNVLVYASRLESERHADYAAWLEDLVTGNQAYAMSDVVLAAHVRIVTNPRVFRHPDPLDYALRFAGRLREQPHCVMIQPGARHWAIFHDLCVHAQAKGNLVADAYFAALAIESGCEWITADRDYARFPGLRWRHPLT